MKGNNLTLEQLMAARKLILESPPPRYLVRVSLHEWICYKIKKLFGKY